MAPPAAGHASEFLGQLQYIDWVGSVPRWSGYKDTWVRDVDWARYRGDLPSKVGYGPSGKCSRIERVRIVDYDRPQPEVDCELLQKLKVVTVWAKEHFQVCRVESVSEFDEGVAEVLASDCAKASPGYPWTQVCNPAGVAFTSKEAALANPVVLEYCRDFYNKLGTNEVFTCLFGLALKDEILRAQKIAEDKTRLFMGAPLEHHLAMVVLCGRMHRRLMNDRGTWCSAGRDFHYGGWHEMMSKLVYEWYIGADQEMYDMSICRILFGAGFEVAREMLPEWCWPKLEDLFAMALDAFCVTGRGDVLWKHTGNPSGWFLTLWLNTVVLYILLAFAWLVKWPDATRIEFERQVKAWLCGDDSLLSICQEARGEYTAVHLVDSFARFGVKVKHVNEGPRLNEMEYCGAYSVISEGRFARLPRVQKFLDALRWTRDIDPMYRLQRAVAIFYEMWAVPEKAIVWGYIEHLFEQYPHLQSYRRSIMSVSRQRLLAIGLE